MARLVAPNSRRLSLGRNFSRRQPFSWTGSETGKDENAAGLVGSAPPPFSAPAVANGEQLVPFRVNSFLLMFTATERMSSLAPPKTSGIALVAARIWAVSGSTKSGTLTTTVPRSKGPATAGVTTTSDTGAPL